MIDIILELMQKKGITASELTKEIGLNHSAVSDWKKGKAKPNTDAVIKLATYFGVSTDYILKGEELHIPDSLRKVLTAANDGDDDITQSELDELGELWQQIKSKRK